MRGRASCSRLRKPARDSKNFRPLHKGSATGEKSVARIAGVNIPTNKRVLIALQYIHGIGQKNAAEIIEKVKIDRKSTRLNSSHVSISYAVFCLKKKKKKQKKTQTEKYKLNMQQE